jgi:hypothetical protein
VLDYSLRNLKTFEIRLRERLRELEQDWLLGRLVSKRGVVDAFHDSADSRRVIVNYDADVMSPATLLDFLHDCGLPAKLAPLRDRAISRSPVATAEPICADGG